MLHADVAQKTLASGTQDLVDLYFDEVSEVPLLTHDEEIALAQRIERGHEARHKLAEGDFDDEEHGLLVRQIKDGQDAIDTLVTANSRLVISIAKRYTSYGVPFSDLIQEGNIGLMRAVKKFDYRRGFKFSTYATWWIRQAVTRALAMQARTIRLPVHKEDEISQIRRTQRQLTQKLGRRPTTAEMGELLGVPVTQVEKTLQESQHTVSLETPVGDEEGTVLADLIEDERAPEPEELAAFQLMRENLDRVLEELPQRERHILRLRYGLVDGQFHTFREVGKMIGVTHERVRQIEATALRRLRKSGAAIKLRRCLD